MNMYEVRSSAKVNTKTLYTWHHLFFCKFENCKRVTINGYVNRGRYFRKKALSIVQLHL